MSTTNILDLNNRIEELEKNSGGGGSADSAKRSDIATEFSTETSYTAGNFVYYEGKLYQFTADHSAGAWDPTDVVEANVTDQIVSNKSAIDGLTASDVAYDNTDSGFTATNVQGAVDELTESYPANKVMMSDGVTSVEDAVDGLIDIVGKVNCVSLSSAVSVPKSTMTTILSLNLTEGTYLITGSYLGFGVEASYFKSMLLMNGDSSSIAIDRRSDATPGGGTITAVVVVPANNTYTIKFKLIHTYSSSLNVSNAYLNSIKIA